MHKTYVRKRNLNSKELERHFGKVHAFVRSSNLKKYLGNQQAKKFFLDIAENVKESISDEEKTDEQGKPYDEREVDEIWGRKFRTEIIGSLVQARKEIERQNEKDQPLDLLQNALQKLNHKNLVFDKMSNFQFQKALKLAEEIETRANKLRKEIDSARYSSQKAMKKRNKS
ncbi:MAG: hypothetical protein IT327_04555 [Anaerolineae bacterium]|nr:hypothetical protein [Anaerolineae bacterium]